MMLHTFIWCNNWPISITENTTKQTNYSMTNSCVNNDIYNNIYGSINETGLYNRNKVIRFVLYDFYKRDGTATHVNYIKYSPRTLFLHQIWFPGAPIWWHLKGLYPVSVILQQIPDFAFCSESHSQLPSLWPLVWIHLMTTCLSSCYLPFLTGGYISTLTTDEHRWQ